MYENEIKKAKNLVKALAIVQFGIILIFVTAILILIHGCQQFFAPSEELVKSYDSPNGTYTVNFYLIDGGAVTGYDVSAKVIDKTVSNTKEKKIYYQHGTNAMELEWLDEHTVMINGSVKLDVRYDTYESYNFESSDSEKHIITV